MLIKYYIKLFNEITLSLTFKILHFINIYNPPPPVISKKSSRWGGGGDIRSLEVPVWPASRVMIFHCGSGTTFLLRLSRFESIQVDFYIFSAGSGRVEAGFRLRFHSCDLQLFYIAYLFPTSKELKRVSTFFEILCINEAVLIIVKPQKSNRTEENNNKKNVVNL